MAFLVHFSNNFERFSVVSVSAFIFNDVVVVMVFVHLLFSSSLVLELLILSVDC